MRAGAPLTILNGSSSPDVATTKPSPSITKATLLPLIFDVRRKSVSTLRVTSVAITPSSALSDPCTARASVIVGSLEV